MFSETTRVGKQVVQEKGLIYRGFLKQGDAQNLQYCVEIQGQVKPFADDGPGQVRLYRWTLHGAFFVTRARKNFRFRRLLSRPVDIVTAETRGRAQ